MNLSELETYRLSRILGPLLAAGGLSWRFEHGRVVLARSGPGAAASLDIAALQWRPSDRHWLLLRPDSQGGWSRDEDVPPSSDPRVLLTRLETAPDAILW